MDQVRIFSPDGIWIEQIRTSVERSWAITRETSAKFYLSVYDTKCNPFVLNYGNLVLVENSDGLPDWVGVIDQRGFEGGACVVWAYTPERYFLYRRGPRSRKLTGNAGEIFAKMIRYINSLEDTVLVDGEIDSDTARMEETINPTVLTNDLLRILQRSGEGYRWRPEVNNGQLTIYADWFPSLVMDTGLILQDGYNVSGDHPMTESAPVNDVLVYGIGNDWEKRILAIAKDEESIEDYGLRQYSASISTKSQASLNATAANRLNAMKQPKQSFPLSALNKDDTFQKLTPGALATYTRLVGQGFSDNGLGYESTERVVRAMAYDPADGSVGLAI